MIKTVRGVGNLLSDSLLELFPTLIYFELISYLWCNLDLHCTLLVDLSVSFA